MTAHGGTAADPLRLGVLGTADIAARRVLPAVAATPGITLAAVGSRDPGRAVAFITRAGGVPVHGYQQLLDRDDVDAVYLPLPAGRHAEWIDRALAAGKHVLAEKPLTTSAADTAALLDRADRSGLVLAENYMFPHHDQHAAVAGLLADGVLGELRSFAATFAVPARPPGDIRLRPELGGGALLDTGGYPVRAAQLFLGAGLRVLAAAERVDPTAGVDIGGSALLVDDAGVTAALGYGIDHAYGSHYTLVGSRARLHLEHAFTPPADHHPVLTLSGPDGVDQVRLPPVDQVGRSVAAFVRAVRDGAPPDPTPVQRQADLIEEIRRAAAHTRAADTSHRTSDRKEAQR